MTGAVSTASGDLGALLRRFFHERGDGLLDERRRIFGLLRDHAPEALRATRILMVAYDQGVPARLAGTEPGEIEIGREAGVLSNETGIDPDLARAAVLTWARALTEYEAQEVAAPPAAAPAPPRPAVPSPSSADRPAPAAAPLTTPRVHQPPQVQPLPPVQPLPATEKLAPAAPSQARPPIPQVQPLSPAPASSFIEAPAPVTAAQPAPPQVQPLPQVQLLPAAASTTPTASPQQPVPSPGPTPQAARNNWLLYIVGAVILLAGVAKGIMWLQTSSETSSSSPPTSSPPPAQSPPAQSPPPAQSSAQGPPAIGSTSPLNTYNLMHLKDLQNSLVVPFGLNVGGEVLTYTVAARFDYYAMDGSTLVNVNRGDDLIATTGAVAGKRFWSKDKELIVGIGGRFSANTANVPPICAFVRVSPNQLEVHTDENSMLTVMAQKPDGSCDSDNVLGFGRVQ